MINARLEQLSQSIKTNAGEAERNLAQLASTTTTAIRSSAQEAERSLTGMSTGVSNVLKQNATEVERTLLGVSAEVARNFVGKAEEITTVGLDPLGRADPPSRRQVEHPDHRARRARARSSPARSAASPSTR